MKKIFLLTALCVAVCSVTRLAAAGDIYGYVYDGNNKGLPNVIVSGKDGDETCKEKTSANGQYTISLEAGNHSLLYEKEGYQTQVVDISLRKNESKYIEMVIMIAMAQGQVPTTIISAD
ncbi:MAG: carboxypeptidase-like regulatory domain-containing protein [Candidatus Brocadiaceae bacterium]|nr:carboxypeptidase-like regulatory domain-containing protein [Candidatus Brocadiaceae bacterium]